MNGAAQATPSQSAPTPSSEPSAKLRAAGLVTVVALVAIDAYSADFAPDPWLYLGAVAIVVWGPSALAKWR